MRLPHLEQLVNFARETSATEIRRGVWCFEELDVRRETYPAFARKVTQRNAEPATTVTTFTELTGAVFVQFSAILFVSCSIR